MSFTRSVLLGIALGFVGASAAPTAALGQGKSAKTSATGEVDNCGPRDQIGPEQRRLRALDHYDRGAVLYEQGDYNAAVDEFVASYCDKPHPEMYLNIGQAYDRLLEFDKAVAYLERYLEESPPTARNIRRAKVRLRIIRQLRARVRVATSPPGARVTMLRDRAVAATGVANSDVPLLVTGGDYTVKLELPDHETETRKVHVSIGQPYSYYFQLSKKKGSLRVTASPASSRIFVGDKLVGVGSYVETIDVGTYDIRVEAKNHEARSRRVVVRAGRSSEATIRLEKPPRSGRWELVTAMSVLGGTSGLALALNTSTTELVGTLTVAGGFVLGGVSAYLGVPDRIPVGKSSYIIGASFIGALEGYYISSLFVCDYPDGREDCNDNLRVGVGLATGVAGVGFGAVTASRFKLDAGDAAVLNSGALWGSVSGLLFTSVFDNEDEVRAPMVAAGLNLGLAAGVTIASRVDVSRGRIALIDLSGIGGIVTGFALGSATDASEERIAHTSLAGMVVGLIAGTWFTRNFDEPDIDVGTLRPTTGQVRDSSGRRTPTYGALWQF